MKTGSMTHSSRMIKVGFILLLLMVLPLGVLGTNAQGDGPTDDEVNAVAHQLYCPVCENVPLDVCPTQACEQWRATIREKLSSGWDEQQIKDFFVEQYGARVLATPPASGLNWLVYILPPLALVVGAYLVFRAVRSWQDEAARQTRVEMPAPDDPYLARLEEELRRREE
jgi:cytochrome c-type biogenesis protein CcmH